MEKLKRLTKRELIGVAGELVMKPLESKTKEEILVFILKFSKEE